MGSLDKRIEALEKLYRASSAQATEEKASEDKRREIIERLNRYEESLRNASPEEWEEIEAWRASPEGRAQREAVEAEIKRRQEGRRYGA